MRRCRSVDRPAIVTRTRCCISASFSSFCSCILIEPGFVVSIPSCCVSLPPFGHYTFSTVLLRTILFFMVNFCALCPLPLLLSRV